MKSPSTMPELDPPPDLADLIRARLRERRMRAGTHVKIADLLADLARFDVPRPVGVAFAEALCTGEDCGWWVVVPSLRCLILTEAGARSDA